MICYYCHKPIKQGAKQTEGLHSACFTTWFHISKPESFSNLVARSADSETGAFKQITNSFFHGKFRKYSANLGHRQFILKVQQAEVPELPATEFLCNQLAMTLNLAVPDHYFVRLENKVDTFVVDNFMQTYTSGN